LFSVDRFCIVDASYAPFLQRDTFLDRVRPLGHLEKFPRLAARRDAPLAQPAVRSFPPTELEALYRAAITERKGHILEFVTTEQAIAPRGKFAHPA